jgi:putative FmdB family regulatory protein
VPAPLLAAGEDTVPTYTYACTDCDEQLEVVQSFTADPLTECPRCGGRLRKVFHPVGVVFKGSGFYRTDSRSGGKANGASGTSAPGSSDKGAKSDPGSTSGEGGSSSGSSTGSSEKSGSSTSSSGGSTAGGSSGKGSSSGTSSGSKASSSSG